MRPYDDDRYLELTTQLNQLVFEFLDTEGNSEEDLRELVDNAIEEAKP